MLMVILWLFFQDPAKFDWALEEEAGIALNWLKQNQMIANPEKFMQYLLERIKQT